jgi:hypothetical protein
MRRNVWSSLRRICSGDGVAYLAKGIGNTLHTVGPMSRRSNHMRASIGLCGDRLKIRYRLGKPQREAVRMPIRVGGAGPLCDSKRQHPPGSGGTMWSTQCAAVSAMRRALQEGQTPRPLQAKATRKSCPHAGQGARAKS